MDNLIDIFLSELENKKIRDVEQYFDTIAAPKDTSFDMLEQIAPLDKFLYDKKYLGLDLRLSDMQYNALLAADDDEESTNKVREVVLMVGKGGGKDLFASLFNLRRVYKLYCLGGADAINKGLPIALLNIAVNARQARNVYFQIFKSLLKKSNWFKRIGYEPLADEIRFPRGITAVSGNSSSEGLEGYSQYSCVLDEIAAFPTKQELGGKVEGTAEYIYDVCKSSIISRFPRTGKMILISYPRYDGDFICRKYQEALKNPQGTYAIKAATWEFNPVRKKEDFDEERRRDPEMWAAKYACNPPRTFDAFFTDYLKIDEMVDPSLRNPLDNNGLLYNYFAGKSHQYIIGVDLSFKHDTTALVVAHKEAREVGLTYVVDLIKIWKAAENKEIDLREIRAFIVLLKNRGLGIKKVYFDQFQSFLMAQDLIGEGIQCDQLSVDRNIGPYTFLKSAIYKGQVKTYRHDALFEELKHLSLVNGKKVDHRDGMSKDISDAFCRAVYGLSESVVEGKTYFKWM